MGLREVHADGIAEAFNRQLLNPGPPQGPESFSAWSFLSAGAKGPVSGGFEIKGSVLDLLGAMQQGETPAEQYRRDKAGIPRIDFPGMGDAARRRADEFAPNPETAHKADQVLHSLTRGVSKAVGSVVALGPVAGPIAFGAEEGNTTAQRLMDEGVDPGTAAKVGLATAAIQGASVAIPGVGPTAAKTFGLAALSGPAAYMAQEKLTKDILQSADYGELASQHDPLDPLGLTLSTVIPFAVGGVHVRSLRKRSVEDVVKHIESGGQRFGKDGKLLTSPKGAQGEMQVMPGTATDPGFGVAPAKDSSPEELARVGRDYLAAMQNRYGDTDKALAAYNAGPGAVDNAIKAKGDQWLEAMPAETKAYVAKANKLMGEAAAAKGASEPAAVDAARVKITDEAMARSLPDTATAHVEVMRASDELAAGRVPDVQPVPTTALPEFKAWFEGSRVVDETGAPMVMYHGTTYDVESFDIENLSGVNFGDKSGGFAFFTNKPNAYPDSASDYAEPGMPGGNVVPAYVALKNPLVYKADGEYSAVFAFDKNAKAIKAAVKAGGYDGVIVKYTDGSSSEVVVAATRPEQVKSAIGNSGKFDPTSGSLTDPLKPGEASPRQQAAAAREPTSQLPSNESPTVEAVATKPATDIEPGAVDPARLKTLLDERPDMLVKMPGSDETVTVETALLRAHEEYDAEMDFADLVKVAAECALANGA